MGQMPPGEEAADENEMQDEEPPIFGADEEEQEPTEAEQAPAEGAFDETGMADATKEELDNPIEPLSPARVKGSISYLTEQYGVSEQEALRRLELQRKSPEIDRRLSETFPDAYGGMWLDQEGGGFLRVAMTNPELLRAHVLTGVADMEDIAPFQVRWSLRELNATAERISRSLGLTMDDDLYPVVSEPDNLVILFERRASYAPQMRLTPTIRARAESVAAAESGRVVLQTLEIDEEDLKICDPRFCAKPPMRAGIRLDVSRDNGERGGCTSGFNVEGSRNGWLYTMTAGHCVQGANHHRRDFTWHRGRRVGYEVDWYSNTAYPVDFAMMPYARGSHKYWMPSTRARNLANSWCRWSDSTSPCSDRDFHIRGYYPVRQIKRGWVVCATGAGYDDGPGGYIDSGAGTGYYPGTRCGQVLRFDGGIVANICARKGDSGGPLFSEVDSMAYGILSWGDPHSGPCTPNEINHYSPIEYILQKANSQADNARNVGFRIIDHR